VDKGRTGGVAVSEEFTGGAGVAGSLVGSLEDDAICSRGGGVGDEGRGTLTTRPFKSISLRVR
jgi:hypothetical protein